jgi:hypothetical protein
MRTKKHILTILFTFTFHCLSACINLKDPLENTAQKYFLKKCLGLKSESLSDFTKKNKLHFELVRKITKSNKSDFYYTAEVSFSQDNNPYNRTYYYEGIINFMKDNKSWTPQYATVYGIRCRGGLK